MATLGTAGQAKSVLSKQIYRQLTGNKNSSETVLYHFCNGRTHLDKSATAVFANLIHIFMQQQGRHSHAFKVARKLGWEPGSSKVHKLKFLSELFIKVITKSKLDTVYCLIDGLDEYDENSVEDQFLPTMLGTAEDGGVTFKFLLTSRPASIISETALPQFELTPISFRATSKSWSWNEWRRSRKNFV